jgi:hypothetical protein
MMNLRILFLKIFEEKTNFKHSFKWGEGGYTMIVKLWSGGNIGGGCIPRDGLRQYFWVRLATKIL